MIAWDSVTKREMQIIRRVALRAHDALTSSGIEVDFPTVEMDITATHIAIQLDLDKLERADDVNFSHDVFGIYRNLNRQSGQLEKNFLPRCAR